VTPLLIPQALVRRTSPVRAAVRPRAPPDARPSPLFPRPACRVRDQSGLQESQRPAAPFLCPVPFVPSPRGWVRRLRVPFVLSLAVHWTQSGSLSLSPEFCFTHRREEWITFVLHIGGRSGSLFGTGCNSSWYLWPWTNQVEDNWHRVVGPIGSNASA
jgi:hypothetical protein